MAHWSGKIKSVSVANRTVTLDQNPNIPDGTPETFDFSNPASDPYATKLTNLWYSWAKYYQDQFRDLRRAITANVSSDTDNDNRDYRILTFGQSHPELAVGMQVTGGGITALTTIVKIATVNNVQTIYLSVPCRGWRAPRRRPSRPGALTDRIRRRDDQHPLQFPTRRSGVRQGVRGDRL